LVGVNALAVGGSELSTSLAELLRTRAPEALDRMLADHGHEIQGVAYLILRDRADAEDVLAETLLAAWQHGPRLRDPAALRPWLLRIAANRSLSHRRTRARVVRLGSLPERTSADHAGSSTTRVALLAEVAQLPPQIRAAIVLRYYADLGVEDVAKALGKSPNTIKAQLQTGLDRLRSAVTDMDETSAMGYRDA
jgi:RNA polymerase sigma factor (sigma-70 family)